MLTYGSRGDVQPFLALAVGMKNAGYEVKIAAPHRFGEWVQKYGIPFIPLAGDPEVISQRLNEAGQNPLAMVDAMMTYVVSIADQVIQQSYEACKDTDLIVHSFLFTTGAHSFARTLGIPDISLQTFPIFAPTKQIAPVFLPRVKIGWLRYFLHWLAMQIFWYAGNMGYRKILREHPDLPTIKLHWPFSNEKNFHKSPLIFAFSPKVIPRAPEWNLEHIYISGYLFLENETATLSKALLEFINQGDAPICISFGSMIHRSLPGIIQTILQGCKESEKRVVLLSGWEEINLPASDQNIFTAKEAPHEQLFPKCSLIIHHGGAGTTAAALRAGVPSLVIPFGADQLYWGLRVNELGIGPAPIRENKVTVDRIIKAIEFSSRVNIREQGKIFSEGLRGENGVEQAIRIIESKIKK
jgi:UDP:flavonoid glycosyltransferase YjiC (YdhE family)